MVGRLLSMGGAPELDSVQSQGLWGAGHGDLKHLYWDQTSFLPPILSSGHPPEHLRSHSAGEFGVSESLRSSTHTYAQMS